MSLDQAKVEHYKTKLAYLVTHETELEADKKDVVGGYNAKIKHIRKLKEALAEAIRFKSSYVLEEELGRAWEDDIEGIQAITPTVRARKDLLARAFTNMHDFGGELTLVKTKQGARVFFGHPAVDMPPDESLFKELIVGEGETVDQAIADLLEHVKRLKGDEA